MVKLLRRGASERRLIDAVRHIRASDRWISFDRFDETAALLKTAFERANLSAEQVMLPVSSLEGDGRWVIPERWDITGATLEITGGPTPQLLADWSKNPFHLVTWCPATPPAGIEGPIVVIDDPDRVAMLRPAELKGCFVLTRMELRPIRQILVDHGALGLVTDHGVSGFVDDVAWQKFGWGGWPVGSEHSRCVGFSISRRAGDALRSGIRTGTKTLRARVQTNTTHQGHPLVTALIQGRELPQEEVWAVAHLFEPGAGDNASGASVSLETARQLQRMIDKGMIERPRRSIRFVHGYECYGLFAYMACPAGHGRPVAGIDVDTVGVLPERCGRQYSLYESPLAMPAHAERIAWQALRAALTDKGSGYRPALKPFGTAGDDLANDPIYGFPMPWVATYPYKGYHSSADRVTALSGSGLKAGVAMLGAYLYEMANLSASGAIELARLERDRTRAAIKHAHTTQQPTGIEGAMIRYRATLVALEQLGLPTDPVFCETLKNLESQTLACADAMRPSIRWRGSIRKSVPGRHRDGALIPRRIVGLTPMLENLHPSIAREYRAARTHETALYYADGKRDIKQIAGLVAFEVNQSPDLVRMIRYFRILEKIGFVRLD